MPKHDEWETLDVAELLQRSLPEGVAGATTSVNAGPYQVPLGPVLRRQAPMSSDSYDFSDIAPEYREMLGIKRRRK